MAQSDQTDETAWWKSELPVIRNELSAYLRARLPALRSEHEDIVSETLLSLTREIQNRKDAFPKSWLRLGPPSSEAERVRLHKLAHLIARRRIADFFRRRARTADAPQSSDRFLEVPDPNAPDPARTILLTRMLATTLSVLAEMSPQDRDLMAIAAEEPEVRRTLDARDRQRLHRVRVRLRQEIIRRLGAPAAELLRTAD